MAGVNANAGAANDGRAELASPAPMSVEASVAALEQKLSPTTDQAHAHFALAALTGLFPPAQVPPVAVSKLFDRYAERFDAHLRDTLDYRVPEQLAAVVRSIWNGQPLDVLDLGCGTGLCGPLVRPMARSLIGADLSAAMLDQARTRGVYDRLQQCDLVAALRQAPRGLDLLLAADVLIYLGDLAPTFEAAAAALRPGGLFGFSVEGADTGRFELSLQSRRYRHSSSYVNHLATIFGFHARHQSQIVIRQESQRPVPGFLVVLQRAID